MSDMYDLVLQDTVGPAYVGDTVQGIGGSEHYAIKLVTKLAAAGLRVLVRNGTKGAASVNGVAYEPHWMPRLVGCRTLLLQRHSHIPSTVTWDRLLVQLHDRPSQGLLSHVSDFGPTIVCVSNHQASFLPASLKKVVIRPFLHDLPTPAAVKNPHDFLFASAALKGWPETRAKWQKFRRLHPELLADAKLYVMASGYDQASGADADASVVYVGKLDDRTLYDRINASAGLFFVNTMEEMYPGPVAIASELGTRAHILCVNGMGGVAEAVADQRFLTADPDAFHAKFVNEYGKTAALEARLGLSATTVLGEWLKLLGHERVIDVNTSEIEKPERAESRNDRSGVISQKDWTGPALAKLAKSFPTDDPLGHGMKVASRVGFWLEFGVAGGSTLRRLAEARGGTGGQVVGFDSFEGLPEAWNGHAAGNFKQDVPPVVPGAEIVVGRFEDTVGPWLRRTQPAVSLVHIDCDLYASAEIALRSVAPYLVDGAVIVFDELVHYHGFEEHEWRALYEVAIRDEAFRFEWLAHRTDADHGPVYGVGPGWQASLMVRKKKRPHIDADGFFQSDKYPTCPAGKVPLSVKDPTAQDILFEYADRREAVDAEFADDLRYALRKAGYTREGDLPAPSAEECALPVFVAIRQVLNSANDAHAKLVFDAVKPFLSPEAASPVVARLVAAEPAGIQARVVAEIPERTDGQICDVRRPGFEISPTGFWTGDDIGRFHECDLGICRWLAAFLDPKGHVTDFGCGPGAHLAALSEAGFPHLLGIEGQVPHKRLFGNVHQGDLTAPLGLGADGDVICLEVAEHIPRAHEDAFLDNVCGRVGPEGKLVLSWAIRNQGGDGHVNCRDNAEVIRILDRRGFEYLPEATAAGRASVDQLWWFKNTLMVFRRRAKEKEEPKSIADLILDRHYAKAQGPWLSELRAAPARKAKNLVVVAYGPGGLRSMPEDDVDILEIWWNRDHYASEVRSWPHPSRRPVSPDGTPPHNKDTRVIADFDRRHRKFGSVAWAMQVPELASLLTGYDAYMFADDDLVPVGCTYGDMFALFASTSARVAHPGLTRDSFYAHECSLVGGARVPHMRPGDVEDGRVVPVDFTELMAPMFTAAGLGEYIEHFGEMVMGHGLERMWSQWERRAGRDVVRLDRTPMLHTRPVASGDAYKGLEKTTDQECAEFLARHGLSRAPFAGGEKAMTNATGARAATGSKSGSWKNIPGWSEDIPEFYDEALKRVPGGGLVVEIGVCYGRSIAYLAQAAHPSIRIVGVDTWDSFYGQERPDFREISAFPSPLHACIDYLRRFAPPGRCALQWGTSVELAKGFEDGSIDLVFIDGGHDYDNVRADIAAWRPKVKKGGILAGHDYSEQLFPGLVRAVQEALGAVTVQGDGSANTGPVWSVVVA